MTDTKLRFNFDCAWQFRVNQKLDEALIAFAKLKDPVRLSGDRDLDLELKILGASLYRARHEIEAAKKAIAEVEKVYIESTRPLPSRLLVERGLNFFYLENYSAAFDDFLNVVARNATETNTVLSTQATLNAVLCAEYLGLSSQSLESSYLDVRRLVHADISGLDSQWQAYQVRRLWALGELEKIKVPLPSAWNQATYHVHYLRTLPFTDEKKLVCDDLTESLRSQPEPYLRSYWLRTLTGQTRSEDLMVNKISESAERVYLWTWFWLAGQEMQLEKIVPYFDLLIEHMPNLHLTQMDQEFISLSLGWISLFSPNFENLKNKIVQQFSIRRNATILPFMEYERLIQGCVESRLRGKFSADDEFVKMVSLHPLHKSHHHDFASILNFLHDLRYPVPTRIQGFADRIKKRIDQELDFEKSEIAVDLEKMTTVNKMTGEKVSSESLCNALQLLSESQSVSCAEFVESVFQQKGYDDYLHSARIFNLLARLRAFLPEDLMVTKKGDRILTRGNWAIVKVKQSTGPIVSTLRVAKVLAPTPVAVSKKFEKLAMIDRPRFNRRDVEKKLQLSRAAAHRLVREWLENGLVESSGSGPSRKYILSEKWRVLNP